mgnify:FL=1
MDDKFREKVKRAIEDGTYKQELEKMNFDRFQSIEIQKGIQSHVDVLKYASPEFDAAQMKSIRLALEDGMDVEAFAKPEYDYIQMEEIKSAIKDGMDVAQLCNCLLYTSPSPRDCS